MKSNKNLMRMHPEEKGVGERQVDCSLFEFDDGELVDGLDKTKFLEEKLANSRVILLEQQRKIVEMKERLNVYELSLPHSLLQKVIRFLKW